MDIFPDGNLVRDIQKELDEIIQQGVFQITKLLQNSETAISSNQPDEESFSMSQRKVNVYKGEKIPRQVRNQTKFQAIFSSQSWSRCRWGDDWLSDWSRKGSWRRTCFKSWRRSGISHRRSRIATDQTTKTTRHRTRSSDESDRRSEVELVAKV